MQNKAGKFHRRVQWFVGIWNKQEKQTTRIVLESETLVMQNSSLKQVWGLSLHF